VHVQRPSLTAQRVARRRAAHQLLDVPPVFVDPLAITILGVEAAAALNADPEGGETSIVAPYLRAFLAARSRVAEDALAEAVAAGVRPYVILGAGLDTFAYRNPLAASGLRVFEVDHPSTQGWKRQRLTEVALAEPPTLTFVPLDFDTATVAEALPRAGFDPTTPSFFSWLGVVPYLDRSMVMEILAYIAQVAGVEGGVVFDYGLPPASLPLLYRVAYEALAARVRAAGEPWRTFFEPAPLAHELAGLGFGRRTDWGESELNARYFSERADRLRVGPAGRVVVARK
jgi:methyltransferase (TIGR00027 family)